MQDQLSSLQEIINGLPIPVILVDKSMRIIAANNEATNYFNSHLAGNSLYLLFRQPEVLDSIDQAFSERKVRVTEINETRNEFETTLKLMFNPVSLDGLGKQGLVLSLIDESLRGNAEEMRKDFVANVSHELKTPLTALSGFIETLKKESWDDPVARRKFLEIIENEAYRMNRLVRDLLSLSKVEVIEGTVPSKKVNLGDVLDIAKNALRPLFQEYGTGINLKDMDPDLVIRGDQDQLIQVFNNLLENAIKYGPPNSMIDVGCDLVKRYTDSDQSWVKVSIKDYGNGFDPILIPRLTERFYRIDKHRSREVGGTGLGLAIVKHILNRHQGRLEIDSEIGKGSVFSVILPIQAQE